MSAQILVDGVPLPPPQQVRLEYTVVAGEERALDGTLHVDMRARKRVLRIQWGMLGPTEMATIEGLLTPWRTLDVQWTEPTGTVTMTAVARPQGRQLVAGRSVYDAAAGRWWWVDVGLVLEEV